MSETESSLNSGRIIRRHLITGLALLLLPLLLLHQTGTADLSQIIRWIVAIGYRWLLWAACLVASSWIAYFMADRLIWPGWLRSLNYDLYQAGSMNELFRKWALCWRCLGYWYGGIISLLIWLFILPTWYGALYFATAGASLGAAMTAFFVVASRNNEPD